jgi:cyclophilin family peptidyl-prolyl cis-trans isomerase
MKTLVAAFVLVAGAAYADDAPAPDGNAPVPDTSAPMPDAEPALPAPAPIVTNGPMARMETSLGTIVIALDREHAPATVANFIRYAREKHFNNTVFYRIEPGFVLQAGSFDPDYKFKGGLHAPIPLESGNGLANVRGAIAMAHGDKPASATAEFFIDLSNIPGLDPDPRAAPNTTGYAVFGHVVEGLDVLDKIAAVKTGGGMGPFPAKAPVTPVVIEKVTISEPKP